MEYKVLPAFPLNSVFVLDRATYHTKLTDATKPASSQFTKMELTIWLLQHEIRHKKMKTVDDWMEKTHVELAFTCKQNAPKPKFVISEVAEKHGVKILFLPVAHPEFKPIELV